MTKFVIEADVIVPHLELQRRQYSVSIDEMHKLLDDLDTGGAEMKLTADELSDLLNSRGQVSTLVRCQGSEEQVRALLGALAKKVYYYKIPWKVEQCEGFGVGDTKFHEYIRAYTVEDD